MLGGVLILEYARSPHSFRHCLLTTPRLAECRQALLANGHTTELTSGAKMFVHPCQVDSVLGHVASLHFDLKPRHVIVSADLASDLEAAVREGTRSRDRVVVKGRQRLATAVLQSRILAFLQQSPKPSPRMVAMRPATLSTRQPAAHAGSLWRLQLRQAERPVTLGTG